MKLCQNVCRHEISEEFETGSWGGGGGMKSRRNLKLGHGGGGRGSLACRETECGVPICSMEKKE